MKRRCAWSAAAAFAAGCAGKMPMTADEFRQVVSTVVSRNLRTWEAAEN